MSDFIAVLLIIPIALVVVTLFVIRRARSSVGGSVKEIPDDKDAPTRERLESAIKESYKIVSAYRAVLEQGRVRGIMYYPESDLPYAKAEIRQAIELLLVVPTDEARRKQLEVADVFLNDFIPNEDYRIVNRQGAGLSQALKCFHADERDADQLRRRLEKRVDCDNRSTTERHKILRLWTLTVVGK